MSTTRLTSSRQPRLLSMPPQTHWGADATADSSEDEVLDGIAAMARDDDDDVAGAAGAGGPGRAWPTSSRQPRQWSMPAATHYARAGETEGPGPAGSWRSSSRQPRLLSMPPATYWSGRSEAEPADGDWSPDGADAMADELAEEPTGEMTDEMTDGMTDGMADGADSWDWSSPQAPAVDVRDPDVATTPDTAEQQEPDETVGVAAREEAPDPRDRSLTLFEPRPTPAPDQPVAAREPSRAVLAVRRLGWRPEGARGRRSGVLVAGMVVVLLLASGVAVWAVNRDQADPAGPSASPTARATKGSTDAGAVRQPRPPRALVTDESYALVRVLPTGDLSVRQWIHSSSPVSAVRLAEPVVDLLPAGAVQASHLRVIADSQQADAPDGVSTSPVDVSFPPTSDVYVSYVLSGAVERSDAPAGRALARVTYLDLTYDPAGSSATIEFTGPEVISLACSPVVGNVAPAACGTQDGDTWVVELPGSQIDYRVMAQLDLGAGAVG